MALIRKADGNEHALVGCLGSNTTHLGSALGLTGHRDLTLLSQSSALVILRRRGLALMSRNRFRANSNGSIGLPRERGLASLLVIF